MSVPLRIEAWQTDTPELPGTWRRTASAEGRWDVELKRWLKPPLLGIDSLLPWTRLEFLHPEDGTRCVWQHVDETGAPVQSIPATVIIAVNNDHVLSSVPFLKERGESKIVARVKLPSKSAATSSTPTVNLFSTSTTATFESRLDALILGVRSVDADPDAREFTLSLLENFRRKALPEITRQEKTIQALNPDYRSPCPEFRGADLQGRLLFTFVQGETHIDLFFGRDRSIEISGKSILRVPEASPGTSAGVFNPDVLSSLMFGKTTVGEA